jgi:anaerobic ribonucleoside-triphosphate reductase activating protein
MTDGDVCKLRIARTKERSSVLGPGTRAIIWFHGCTLDCPGCIAHEMNRSSSYELYSPESLLNWLTGIDGIEGVTLSGGDPFDQPKDELLQFLRFVKSKTNLSVMCYTGRTLQELLLAADHVANLRILEFVDILVDGPYEQLKNEGHQWRGSSNQKIHFLTHRYLHLEGEMEQVKNRAVEIELSLENRLTITGIPEVGFLQKIRKRMELNGVAFRLNSD